MTDHTVDFEPSGRTGECREKESLLECARRSGVGLSGVCGGRGICHSCKVEVPGGSLSVPTPSEREAFSSAELGGGWRLACQAYPASDCRVKVPAESMTTPQRIQVEGLETKAELDPPVKGYRLEMPAPTLDDAQADADRLLETLNRQHRLRCHRVDIDVLRALSPQLRSWEWQCRAAVRADEVVALGPWPGRHLGLAIDLGTTRIAGYLVDLSSGRTLSTRGMTNLQTGYGQDITGVAGSVAGDPGRGMRLQRLAVEAMNHLAADLCADVGATREEIVDAVVVGNTVMHHLMAGLPVRQLTSSPSVPAISRGLDVKGRDLGLQIAPGAYVYLLPNIAGYVGADHVAVLLSTEAWQAEGLTLVLDIGTNTEVSLVCNRRTTAVSCASGPAFEGRHIKDGGRAVAGAIERLRLADDGVHYQTIDGAPAAGICGSGVLDAMAQLYLHGILDEDGTMKDGHPRVRPRNGEREFVLLAGAEGDERGDIVVTQADLRELQLAKAAIRTGIQMLLDMEERSEEEIDAVIVAGAFETYIDLASAVAVGLLPPVPLDRIRQVGNAAGTGARLALVSSRKREQAQAIASGVNYVELAGAPDFTQIFIQASYIGRYRIVRGQRKAVK